MNWNLQFWKVLRESYKLKDYRGKSEKQLKLFTASTQIRYCFPKNTSNLDYGKAGKKSGLLSRCFNCFNAEVATKSTLLLAITTIKRRDTPLRSDDLDTLIFPLSG